MQKLVLAAGVSSISIASFFSVQAADAVHRSVLMPSSSTSTSAAFASRNQFSSSSAANFSGLYGGVSIGGNLSGNLHGELAAVAPAKAETMVLAKGSGFAGALHGGFNHQHDQFIVGVEGDAGYSLFGFTGVDDEKAKLNEKPVKNVKIAQQTFNGSLRARAGFEVVDSIQIFATAGVTGAIFDLATTELKVDNESKADPKAMTTDLNTSMALGFTGGIGVEGIVADDITARLEFRHTRFPASAFGFIAHDKNLIKGGSVTNNNAINLGVSFKF